MALITIKNRNYGETQISDLISRTLLNFSCRHLKLEKVEYLHFMLL